jgi:hypothetical protein
LPYHSLSQIVKRRVGTDRGIYERGGEGGVEGGGKGGGSKVTRSKKGKKSDHYGKETGARSNYCKAGTMTACDGRWQTVVTTVQQSSQRGRGRVKPLNETTHTTHTTHTTPHHTLDPTQLCPRAEHEFEHRGVRTALKRQGQQP